jgi:uncharacterized membrane protein YkgB
MSYSYNHRKKEINQLKRKHKKNPNKQAWKDEYQKLYPKKEKDNL